MLTNCSMTMNGSGKTVSFSEYKTVFLSPLARLISSFFDSGAVAFFNRVRLDMVEDQLQHRNIQEPAVLASILKVPKHLIFESEYMHFSCADSDLY